MASISTRKTKLQSVDLIALLKHLRSLVSTAVLAYTLGLRHALDADHISVGTRRHGRVDTLLCS